MIFLFTYRAHVKLMLVSFKDLFRRPMNVSYVDDYKIFFHLTTHPSHPSLSVFSITEYFPFDEQTCVMKFGKHREIYV